MKGKCDMNVRECYEKMGADFNDVLDRLGTEAIVARFAKKFPDDDSYAGIFKALDKGDLQEAFRAVHTLKGVCLNLGFTQLHKVSFELTELFRTGSIDGADELLEKLKEQYAMTVAAIKQID